jgi:outer membrane protein OmpA-like peptidoglycan-associated protein
MNPSPLLPCPACRRHVRIDATVCPFCSGRLDPEAAGKQHRLRLAQITFNTAVAAAILGCGATTATPPQPAPPAVEKADAATAHQDAGDEAPMVDAGVDARSVTVIAEYGAPIILLLPVSFHANSTRFTSESEPVLRDIATELAAHPHLRVMAIRGCAYPHEGKAAGWLAKRRAELTRDRLVELGVEPERLRVVSGTDGCTVIHRGPSNDFYPGTHFDIVEVED